MDADGSGSDGGDDDGAGVDDDGNVEEAAIPFCCSIKGSEADKDCTDSMKDAGIVGFKRKALGRALRANGVLVFGIDGVVIVEEINGNYESDIFW